MGFETTKLLVALVVGVVTPFSTFGVLHVKLMCLNPKLVIQSMDNGFPQLSLAHLANLVSIQTTRQKGWYVPPTRHNR
jgi:hypothetical protein